MTADLLDSTGRCSLCKGVVTNTPDRKGHSLDRLTDVHRASCPAIPARRKAED